MARGPAARSQPSAVKAAAGSSPRPSQKATTRSASGSLAQSPRTQRLMVWRETPVRRETSVPLQARSARASSSARRTKVAKAIFRALAVSVTP